MDSTSAIALILQEPNDRHPYASVLNNVRSLLKRDWVVSILHVYREGNRAADHLAYLGDSVHIGVCFFELPPASLGSLFRDDLFGVIFPRLVVSFVLLVFGRLAPFSYQK